MLLLDDIHGIDWPTDDLDEHVARHVAELDKDERAEIIFLPDVGKMPRVDAGFGIVIEIADVILVRGVQTLATNLQIRRFRPVLQDRHELEDPVQLNGDARLTGFETVRHVGARGVRLQTLLIDPAHRIQIVSARLRQMGANCGEKVPGQPHDMT